MTPVSLWQPPLVFVTGIAVGLVGLALAVGVGRVLRRLFSTWPSARSTLGSADHFAPRRSTSPSGHSFTMRRLFGPLLVVLVVCVGALELRHLSVDRGYEALLPAGDRSAADYAFVRRAFRNDQAALVVVEGPGLWTPRGLRALRQLSDDLQALDGVDRVTGLPTAQYITGSADAVQSGDFFPEDLQSLSAADARALCDHAVHYAPYQGWLVNHDGSAVLLFVVARAGTDPTKLSEAVDAVVAAHRADFAPDGGLFQSGSLEVSAELSRATRRSSRLLVLTLLIVFVVTWAVTRSIGAAGCAALTGVLAALLTFAFMGAVGTPLNSVNVLVPNLLIPLGAAFAIHACGYVTRDGSPRFGSLPRSAVRPFAFATLSTVIGFGATAFSSIPAVRQFGMLGCFGIVACAFITVFLTFPVLSGWLRSASPPVRSATAAVFRFPERTTWLCAALVLLLSLAGLLQIDIDYAPIDYFSRDTLVHRRFDRLQQLFGAYAYFVAVPGRRPGDAIEPARLRALRELAADARAELPAVRFASINDPLAVMQRAFTAGDPAAPAFPATSRLVAQYLLLFSGDTSTFLDRNRMHLNMVALTPFHSAHEFRRFEAAVTGAARREGLEVIVTGRVAQFFRASESIARGQIRSLLMAGVFLTLLFFVVFRSWRLALLAMVPNLLPVLTGMSLLGWFGIHLDIGTSLAGSVALGLVVDDTAHLLANYNRSRALGMTAAAASEQALIELWKPITLTSLCIVAGFLALVWAELMPFRTFGVLLAVVMVVALFGDLALLPVLLKRFDHGASLRADAGIPV